MRTYSVGKLSLSPVNTRRGIGGYTGGQDSRALSGVFPSRSALNQLVF